MTRKHFEKAADMIARNICEKGENIVDESESFFFAIDFFSACSDTFNVEMFEKRVKQLIKEYNSN